MSDFVAIMKSMDRANHKLDLLLELVHAQKAEDWGRVHAVCKQLDELKVIKK